MKMSCHRLWVASLLMDLAGHDGSGSRFGRIVRSFLDSLPVHRNCLFGADAISRDHKFVMYDKNL